MSQYRARILLVDDELGNIKPLKKILEQEAFAVETAESGEEALRIFRKMPADIVLTDMRMGGMSGLELLQAVRGISSDTPVVIITAFGTVDDAVVAMKLGAVDFLSKPVSRREVLRAVQDCLERMRSAHLPRPTDIMIGESPAMIELRRTIRMVAPTRASVLVSGESGSGKEVVAKAIHQESGLSGKLVSVNCSAIPETLLESELFGYERGAFTGAAGSKQGLFDAANNGTLFLDEIADMPLALQSKLLRVLEDGTFLRLGSVQQRTANVRLIAATNADLEESVRLGKFREDLWFRLNVINLLVPPLRQRGQDKELLARHFLNLAANEYGKTELSFTKEALELINTYHWPGNVRELYNTIQRAVVLATDGSIRPSSLRLKLPQTEAGAAVVNTGEPFQFALGTSLKEMETEMIKRTLAAMGGDKALTAKILGINLRTIYRKLNDIHDGDAK